MPIFKKKKKIKIPDAPDFTYPEVEEIRKTIKKLPQEDYDLPRLPELPELPEIKGPEKRLPIRLTQEINKSGKKRILKIKTSHRIGPRPIFIKVNRFKEILSTIEIIEKRIHEIDIIIKKLKEIRLREDQQMTNWEQEIEELKKKIETVQRIVSEIE